MRGEPGAKFAESDAAALAPLPVAAKSPVFAIGVTDVEGSTA
jgi:hypothetical protein